MARLPLFKSVPRPLDDAGRLRMVQQARRGLAEKSGLNRASKARGLLALHKAEERLRTVQPIGSRQTPGS